MQSVSRYYSSLGSSHEREREKGRLTFQSSKEWEIRHFECFRPIHQIRHIELTRIVTNDQIRIDFLDERSPL